MAVHESLKVAYEDIAYVGRPNPNGHPQRLAAIGRLFGLEPPPVETARVLEVGCGDGANLLPMAVALPGARFTGCDFSALLMSRARRMADGLGVGNVELIEGDLRRVAPTLGTYDYILAHGFYSWVPEDVRDALMAVIRDRLAPRGLAFVTFNVQPGFHVRRIARDLMRFEIGDEPDPAKRLAGVRRITGDIARAWSRMDGLPALLAPEMATLPGRSDSALYHDDLSGVNQAYYFSQFVAHAGSCGLGFVSEAEAGSLSATGLPPRLQELIAKADPIAREQTLDFARLRRFRQSVLARLDDVRRARLTPEALERLHFSAATPIVQERAAGEARSVTGTAIDVLVDRYPATYTRAQYADALVARGFTPEEARNAILRGCFTGAVDLHASALNLSGPPGERPTVWRVARWQATHEDVVTNLRHEGVRLDDPAARALAIACDGTRDRRALAAALPEPGADAAALVDHYLERFALAALFEPTGPGVLR